MKLKPLFILLLAFAGCTMPEEKPLEPLPAPEPVTITTSDSNNAADMPVIPKPPVPAPVKHPKGVYHTNLPSNGGTDHMVAFYPDFTYQLQESYKTAKKDTVVVITGNWAPSNGYIWLYKDQVVRARYKWNDNELQYYSPASKKGFPLQPMTDVLSNPVWKEKPRRGVALFGIGNEPFWSVEVNGKDSLVFQLADWDRPVRLKISSFNSGKDSSTYTAQNDSVNLKLHIFPYFCSDGMSDHVYKNRIRLLYNQKTFNGCGVLFQ